MEFQDSDDSSIIYSLIIDESEFDEASLNNLDEFVPNQNQLEIGAQNGSAEDSAALHHQKAGDKKKRKRAQSNEGNKKQTKIKTCDKKKEEEPRFNVALDIKLLTEILAVLPMLVPYKERAAKWKEVKENLKVDFGVPSIQRRFNTLLDKFKEEELESLKSSGTDEEKTERSVLLTDIHDIITDYKIMPSSIPSSKSAEEKSQKLMADDIRGKAMQTLKEKRETNHSPTSPKTLGTKKRTVLDLLQENHVQDTEYRQQKLEFLKEKFSEEINQRNLDREIQKERLQLQGKKQEDDHQLMMALIHALKK